MATPTEKQDKVFNDPIHGSVVLHPLLVKIIDTPQFQRLRYLKQLGATYWVYPGATHNRFEHSIGVCYLAGQLVEALRSQDEEAKTKEEKLNITKEDVLCVKIAGLCHDLGHGPFSHMFDNMFIPRAQEKKKCPREDCPGERSRGRKRQAEECPGEKCPRKKWTHEKASVMMFDHLLDVGLKDARKEDPELFEILNDNNRLFIKELIDGPQNQEGAQSNEWPYEGRTKDKSFLYEIVANKRNGIDVDKWDYFARDCHHLGIQNNFDYRRFIAFARVCEDENRERQICIRNKEVRNVYDMFHTRQSLYLKACNHRVCNIIENMVTEAFLKADEHLEFEGSNGKMFTLSETIYDMEAYTNVTDHVFNQLLAIPKTDLEKAMEQAEESKKAKELAEELVEELAEDSDELKKAKELAKKLAEKLAKDSDKLKKAKELDEARMILEKITKRDFYKFVGETRPQEHMPHTQEQCRTLEAEIAQTVVKGEGNSLVPEDLVVDVVTIDHRIKKKNPWEKTNPSIDSNDDANKGNPNPDAQVVTVNEPEEEKVNPLDKVRVYSKYYLNRGIPIPEAQRHRQLPDSLAEQLIRVYCKKTESVKAAKEKFEQWCDVHAYTKWMEISKAPEQNLQQQPGPRSATPDPQQQPGPSSATSSQLTETSVTETGD